MKIKLFINIISLALSIYFVSYISSAQTTTTNQTVHDVEVISVMFIPDTDNDGMLDENLTGIPNMKYSLMESKIIDNLYTGLNLFTMSTAYHSYKDTSALPSIRYDINSNNIKIIKKMPSLSTQYQSGGTFFPDYLKVLSNETEGIDLCTRINSIPTNKAVEVWMWTPHYGDYNIVESKTWGTHPQIKEVGASGPLKDCGRPYVFYNFSILVGPTKMLHNRAHRLEHFLSIIDIQMAEKYMGMTRTDIGNNQFSFTIDPNSCGDAHIPPYATGNTAGYWFYGYDKTDIVNSSCENFTPSQNTTKTAVSKDIIYGYYINDSVINTGKAEFYNKDNDVELSYLVWWMQNIPGYNNDILYNNKPLRNFWDMMVDYDDFMNNSRNFLLASDTAGQSMPGWTKIINPNNPEALAKTWGERYSKSSPSNTSTDVNLYPANTVVQALCLSDDKAWVKINTGEYIQKGYLYIYNPDDLIVCSDPLPTGTYTNKSTSVRSTPSSSGTTITTYLQYIEIQAECKVTGTPIWIKEKSSENRYIVSTDLNNISTTLAECPPINTPPQLTVYTGTAKAYYNVRSGPATSYPKVYVTVPGQAYSVTCQKTNQGIIWAMFTDGNYSVKANILGLPSVLPTCGVTQPTIPNGTYTNKTSNVRSGPGTTFSLVGTYNQYTVIVPTCKITNTSGTWIKETSTQEKFIFSSDLNNIPSTLDNCPIIEPPTQPTQYSGISKYNFNVRSTPKVVSSPSNVVYQTGVGVTYKATCHITTNGYVWVKLLDGNFTVKSNLEGMPSSMPICVL